MKNRFALLGPFAFLVLSLGAVSAWAQLTVNTPRALGMGNAFIAVSDDEGAVLANPAGLALIRDGRVAVGSLGLTNQEEHWYTGYILPSSLRTVQGTALYFSKTTNNVANTRNDRTTWSAGQYYAQGVAVGLSLSFLRASDDNAGTEDKAFGVDLGVLYALPASPGKESPGTIGVLIQNPNQPRLLGVKQPQVLSIGVATHLMPGLLVAADSYNIFDEAGAPQERSVGVEFEPVRGIALRGGYMTEAGVFTLGAGLRGQSFNLDAAWASEDGGEDTGYVGMGFLF